MLHNRSSVSSKVACTILGKAASANKEKRTKAKPAAPPKGLPASAQPAATGAAGLFAKTQLQVGASAASRSRPMLWHVCCMLVNYSCVNSDKAVAIPGRVVASTERGEQKLKPPTKGVPASARP